ncbi:DnaB-like helicase N-terminal domain-containing protein [Allostreptomyces psammosilenae]|uniref:Replicative DNA helicase n=1 Tax=Allostreptomyces psammosilenae TaxID=1892865 RepID=A0A852ZYR4_9ACTN|nr:DnaB-like helicase N-terminal domain-containing protein [Allostreptomyces psammosilenae]NYI03422.1 replicative DNA helicase [Allostreptomyces psammosilenae]
MRPLLRAEQAVLGALLFAPGQLDRLAQWLRPEHFYRPQHAALYAAMLHLRQNKPAAALPAADGDRVEWISATLAEAGTHTRGLFPAYAHALISACPDPRNAPVYGRMVLEGAIHRTVTEHATRLHQAARADLLRGESEETLRQVDILTEVLADLARQWGTRPATTAASTNAAPAAVCERHRADEQLLLATLIDRPDSLDSVVRWLRPEDFADRGHGQLYRCLAALHHRGEPIDPLTVLWEAQRRGLLAQGVLTADQVDGITRGLGAGDADYVAEALLQTSLIRTAASAARSIQAAAGDDALPPGRLISEAIGALDAVAAVRQRWREATAASPPPDSVGPEADTRARAQAAKARGTTPSQQAGHGHPTAKHNPSAAVRARR